MKTDEKHEQEKGRIPVWLDPTDIIFLAKHSQNLPETTSEEHHQIWDRIRFRLNAALHKNGHKS